MLKIFFEQGQKFTFLTNNFLQTTNKLDSHKYSLQRIPEPTQNYIQNYYFDHSHPHIITYYNSWLEKENVVQEVISPKVNKKKGSINSILLSKKNKGQNVSNGITSKGSFTDKITQKDLPKSNEILSNNNVREIEVLYIQLQSFSLISSKIDYDQGISYMSIVYLLAQKIHYQFTKQNQNYQFQEFQQNSQHKNLLTETLSPLQKSTWPIMIPINTQDGILKFLKKGKTLDEQIYRLFKHTFQNEDVYQKFPKQLSQLIIKADMNGQKDKELLVSQIKNKINSIIQDQYPLKIIRGNLITTQNCKLTRNRNLLLTQSNIQIPLEQFEVDFSYAHQENRQIVLEHMFLCPIVLIGNRTNFLIKYLKQLQKN